MAGATVLLKDKPRDIARLLHGAFLTLTIILNCVRLARFCRLDLCAGYDAPFAGLGYEGHAGARRFPMSLPFDNPEGGDTQNQKRCFETLQSCTQPIHFIWGVKDPIFTEAWGRA